MDILDWALSVWELDTDFLIEGNVELPPLPNIDNIRYSYNQGSTLHCTLYWPMWAVSDLMNYQFSPLDIRDIIDLSISRGKPENAWWQTVLWVKCVVDFWNSTHEEKLIYYRLDVPSLNFTDALKKGYTIVMTYRGNSAYNADVYDDAIVEKTEFWTPTYGHCTTSIWLDGNGIKDSYVGRKWLNGIPTNEYKLSDLQKLVENKVFYPCAYIIIPQQTKSKEEIKRLMDFKSQLAQKTAINAILWRLTNDEHYKDELTSEDNISKAKIADIETELKKL